MAKNYDLNSNQTLRSQFKWAYRRPPTQDPIWTSMPQPAPPTPWGRLITTATIGAGIIGTGFAPIGGGKRMWDFGIGLAKGFEELTPGKIGRTFQLSDALSPFSAINKKITLGPEVLTVPKTREFIANMLGRSMHEVHELGVFGKGLEFERTGMLFGTLKVQGGAVLSHAVIPATMSKHAGGSLVDWYARMSGVELGTFQSVFGSGQAGTAFIFTPKVDKVFGIPLSDVAQVWFSKAHTLGRMGRTYAASQIARLNRLLQTPLEFFPKTDKVLKYLGLPPLTVRPGGPLSMLGRYAAKGVAIGAGIRGIQYLSYLRGQTDNRFVSGLEFGALGGLAGGLLRKTRFGALVGAGIGLGLGVAPVFDQGLIPGAGTMVTRVSKGLATISEKTGMTQSAREQEAFMPGITKLQTALGFIGSGFLFGSLASYGLKLREYTRTGIEATDALLKAGKITGGIKDKIILRGGRLGALAGLGLYGGFAIAGAVGSGQRVPGILSTKYTPKELEQFYSGEKEVPVRAGRWWEAGRCLTKSTTYILFDGTTKTSDQLQIGDVLIGRDFKPAVVTNIHVRYHTGTVRTFFTAFDRDISTGVTDEHIIPVLQDGEVYEIPAGKLQINQFVECAYKKLDNTLSSLDPIDHLQVPVIIKDNRIFATQHNWFTGNLQQSGTTSIPTTLDLDYDLGLLFGYYLAEGSIGFRQGNPTMIELCFAVSESEYVDDIVRIVQEKFQTQPTVRHKTTDKKTKDGCLIIRICNSVLAKLFRWLFYQQQYNAYQKDIPSFLDSANDNFKAGVIEGYWRGDGHYDNTAKVITSSRKWLLQHIQLWALNLGQACGISPHGNENPSWRLRFYVANSTNAGCMFIKERLFSRVRQIHIDEYNDLVYDFEVDDSDHLLQAGTFLVHNSRFEGGRAYYRPHWYRLMQTRARDIGMYDTEAEKFDSATLLHPIKALTDEEFKYRWEKRHYYSRPYPMSGTYGSNIPFVAPIAEALGSIIKPPKTMHIEEWTKQNEYNELAAVHIPTAGGNSPAYDLGETLTGWPVSRYSASQQAGELAYRLNELRGLPGFIHGAIKEKLTGSADYADQYEQIETANRAYGMGRGFWNLQLGGGIMSTEAIRRFLPHQRNQIEQYNPIRNLMPAWMPSEDYFIDFRRGDPYCVTGDTFIEIENRLVPARQVKQGDLIKTHLGNLVPIRAIKERFINTDEKVFEFGITTLSGFPIKTSEEHPFLTPTGWVQAKELCVGDYVGYPLPTLDSLVSQDKFLDLAQYTSLPYTQDHIYIQGTQEYANCVWFLENVQNSFQYGELKSLLDQYGWSRKTFENAQRGIKYKSLNRIPRFINPHSKEWGVISGYWLSEGSCNDDSLNFAFHVNETEYIDELNSAFKVLFDRTGRVYFRDGTGGCAFIITCKALTQIIPTIWGSGFDKKHLSPQWDGSVKETLKCLFNGDGSFFFDKNKPRLSLKLQNIQLLWEVRRQLLTFGFVGSIVENNLILRGQAAKDCALFLGCKHKTCLDSTQLATHYYIKDNYVWMRIYSKKEVPDQIVYGFEVDIDDSFCLSGVATHNTKVVEGEIRLPGPGYEALHPELTGLSPDQYPAFHRFKILADVALWSDQLKVAQKQVSAAIQRGELTPAQVSQVEEIKRQITERKQRKRVNEYRFARDVLEKRRVTIAEQVDETGLVRTTSGEVLGLGGIDTKGYRRQQARVSDFLREHVGPGTDIDVFVHRDPAHQYKKTPGGKSYYMPAVLGNLNRELIDTGVLNLSTDKEDPFAAHIQYNAIQRGVGRIWEKAAHYESPVEYITPFSPKAKFIHQRSGIEEYERSRVWGTEASFWQHPIRHFLRPAKQMADLEWFGQNYIPEDVRKRWAIEEYFDKLKYIKYKGLETAAWTVGDQASVTEFQQQQRRTLIGANLYGNPSNLVAALPSLDRDYFKSFTNAQTAEERKKILEMVAPNQQGLYIAQWQRQFETALRAQQSMGIGDSEAATHLKQIELARMAEGRPINPELFAQYEADRQDNERYADWSRKRELQAFFSQAPLPKADWVGFHPTVDLEDVKLQVVENLGMDMHDFNLWESRKRELVHKPYLDQEAPLGASGPSHPALQAALSQVLRNNLQLQNVHVSVLPAPEGHESIEIEIEDDRVEVFRSFKKNSNFAEMK